MKLPVSWLLVPIAAVCDINPRIKSEEKPPDDALVTFVPMSAVDENTATIAQPEIRKYSEVSKGYTYFKPNDVLFAKVTPCMENGKAAIARDLENGLGFGSTEFHVLRPSELILPEYLLLFIQQPSFREFAKSSFIGTGGLQRVPPGFFRRASLPLPTIIEQKRIVGIFQEVEQINKKRNSISNLLLKIRQQFFLEVFGDPNPKFNDKWPVEKIGSTIEVGTGGTPSRSNVEYFNGDIPWVKSTELTDTLIENAEEKISKNAISTSNAKIYPKGTILIAMYGQGQTRGRTGKLSIDATCNQACAALIPNEHYNQDYLWLWLQLSYEYIRSLGRGGQQENLNLKILRNIKIPKPPIALQNSFSRIFHQLLYLEDRIIYAGQKNISYVEQLIGNALVGELTENWRQTHQREISKLVSDRIKAIENISRWKVKEHKEGEESKNKKIQTARSALLNELSKFQKSVRTALQKLNRTLIPDDTPAMDQFCNELATNNENNLHDRALRALDQLTALGLIAKVSLPNNEGHYLNGYRILREGESRRMEDIQSVNAALKHLETQKAAG